MRYSGSKARIAKYLLPIITEHLSEGMVYLEPFVGGCNMFDKVVFKDKIGCDSNGYVISMWKEFQNGTMPPQEISEETYSILKDIVLNGDDTLKKDNAWLIGYVMNSCSYGSAWMNGYARYNAERGENHVLEAYRNVVKQISSFEYFKDSVFYECSYDSETVDGITDSNRCVIYCDPPYQNTKGYKDGDFDSDAFWEWVRKKSREGHYVYVSEYSAPTDFECVWEMGRKDGMAATEKGGKQKTKVERLFVYNG